MKKIYVLLTLFVFSFLFVGNIFANSSKEVQDLPLFVDFELFNGVNLHEVYPGWNQGKGLPPTPTTISSSAWYRADALFGSAAAAVSFSYAGLKDEWIISPQFLATETTKLSFMAALTRFWDDPVQGNLSHNDSVSVMVATEGYAFTETVYSFKYANQPDWQSEFYDIELGAYTGQTIRIAFYATNGQEPNSLAAFHVDDIVIKNAVAQDAMVVGLVYPSANVCFEEDSPVVVRIKNDGLEPITSVPVLVRIRGAVIQNLYNAYQGVIAPGEYADVEVGIIDNLPFGEYHFEIETQLPNDGFEANNVVSDITHLYLESRHLPLPIMTFVGFYYDNLGDLYPGWFEARGKDRPRVAMNTDWQGANYDGARTANVYYSGLGTEDWIVSPLFTASGELVVELHAAVEYDWGTNQMGSDDKLAIMVSPDCGESWEEAAALTNESGLTESLQEFTFAIEGYGGQDIILGFYATTGSINNPQSYLMHLTDINIKSLHELDAGVTQLLAPGNSCSFSDEEEVIVRIENFGTQTISDFSVAYELNNQDPVMETVSESIAYGETLDYVFTQPANLSGDTQHSINVYTLLEDDGNSNNDGLYDIQLRLSSFDLSTEGVYFMSFEEDEDFYDWHVEDGNNDGISWGLVQDGQHANTGEYSYAYFSNQTSVQSNDWLFSPCFNLEAGQTYYISFYYKNRATNWPESLKLNLGTAQTGSAMDQLLIDLGQISNPPYMKAETTFTVAESGEYYFGWHAYGPADQFGMHIDDVTIYQVFEYDLALTNYINPREKDENCMLQPAESLEVEVTNFGEQDIVDFSVGLLIGDGDPVTYDIDEGIASGESLWITLENGFVIPSEELVDMAVWTDHPQDINTANDTLYIPEYLMTQFYTSFEAHENTDDWEVENLAGVNEWHHLNNPSVSRSGDYVFAIRTDGAGGNTSNDDWLFSECFYLEAGTCYEISFHYRSHFSTENLAVYLGDGQAHTAMTEQLINLPSFNTNNYEYTSAQFTVDESGIYHFGWHTDGGTSGRYFIYIDDVAVIEDLANQPVADPEFLILDQEVAFFANAENVSSLLWDFGDGNTSEEENPFNIYDVPGNYDVTLTVSSGCVDVTYEIELELVLPVYSVQFNITDQQSNVIPDAVVAVGDQQNGAGEYLFDLNRGGYAFTVERTDYESVTGNFTVIDDDIQVDVQMSFTGVGYKVSFDVIDSEGEVIDDAVIVFNGIEGEPGEYVIENVLPGVYEYGINKLCYITALGEVQVIDAHVQVEEVLAGRPGDANGDGVINVLDVIAMVSWFIDSQPDPFCFDNADVNQDGVINVLDVIATVTIFARN
jgi:hypothetical protein